MKYSDLYKIDKLYFGYEDLARALGIEPASVRVSASRYVKQGLLLRIKRNLYVRRDIWISAGQLEKFKIANMGLVPSYISLATALYYYGVTTQVQRNFFESIAIRKTKEISINTDLFRYTKISVNLYSGFVKEKGIFIATPEKAILDAFYLMSYGRYALDVSALDAAKLDYAKIKRLAGAFPPKTRKLLEKYEYLRAA